MEPLKLDIGCGKTPRPGYVGVDRQLGSEAYPLAYADNSADEIYASHILEHFGHEDAPKVLRDWVRVLKVGGKLRLAVPDFEYIAKGYLAHGHENWGGYLMGGQVSQDDFHRTVFDYGRLRQMMTEAGLTNIQRWTGEVDSSSLPVSLNLEGIKSGLPAMTQEIEIPAIAAVMSVPRLAFCDNMFSATEVASELRIPFLRFTGAFWGQCLERALEQVVNDGIKYVLTIDYDTVFTVAHVLALARAMEENPHIDALAPIQCKRGDNSMLMSLLTDDGKAFPQGTKFGRETFERQFTRAAWAHFGLTMLRVDRLRDLPHPWFHSIPDPNGKWDDGRTDDDIYFWRKWFDHGRTLYLANRVPIGHCQLMISWPGADGRPLHQYTEQYAASGIPREVWR